MGFTVNFYKFSKKVNSTARPSEPQRSFNCRIKEPCGVFNPAISLDLGLTDSPREYNYAFIPTFDRYYFVKEWLFKDGLWNASLEVDVLASWKISIGSETCYILRSSEEYDLEIMDTTYPATNFTVLDRSGETSPWITDSIDNGTFVVGIAGQSTTYYLFTRAGLDLFFDWLFSDVYADSVVGGWVSIYPQLKAQLQPMQFITSIMWLPLVVTGTPVSTIRVGWGDVTCVADRVDGSGIRSGIHTFTIKRHPQVLRGKYLNNAPYSSYSLFYPPWGTIPLDSNLVSNADILSVVWNLDIRTGHATLNVLIDSAEVQTLTSWVHSQVGVNYQVSQVLNSGFGVGNVLSTAASMVPALASGNLAGGATAGIAGGIGAIGDFAQSRIPSASTIGSTGSVDALRGIPALQCEFKRVVDEDIEHRGRPLCKNKRIDTLGGYMIVADADISIASTKQEQDAIRTFMEGGFFYE